MNNHIHQIQTCQMCGEKPHPGCNSEFQGFESCRFYPRAEMTDKQNGAREMNYKVGDKCEFEGKPLTVTFLFSVSFLAMDSDGKEYFLMNPEIEPCIEDVMTSMREHMEYLLLSAGKRRMERARNETVFT